MNRNQRRLGRLHQKRNIDVDHRRGRNYGAEVEELLSPKNRVARLDKFVACKSCHVTPSKEEFARYAQFDIDKLGKFRQQQSKTTKFNTTKACNVSPSREDFSQTTETETTDKYQKTLKEQYGFDPLSPLIPETITHLRELKKMLCVSTPKVDDSSQYVNTTQDNTANELNDVLGCGRWQKIDSTNDVDDFIDNDQGNRIADSEPVTVSQTPRIKVIARKYSRYRKDNIELRKLEEEVVCVEYDVFVGGSEKPRQKLRAFFCIKPSSVPDEKVTATIPSEVKHKFKIANEDLSKLHEKEIEIIDENIQDNKPYLDDLKRILKRNQAIYIKKNKDSLDLMFLYEMAKRQGPLENEYSNANFLSKSELEEIKELILKKCASSAHGIKRKTVKKDSKIEAFNTGVVSKSIVAELLRGQC